MKSWKMDRRDFLRYVETGAMGVALSTGKLSGGVQKTRSETAEYGGIMPEVKKYRKIDSHNHIDKDTDLAKFIETADRLEIEWLAVSRPVGPKFVEPHEVRDLNDIILNGMKKYPNRILGQCFINPHYPKEALEEIDRCFDAGMVQLGELYHQARINEPVYFPIIEKCIELKIPLMMHAGKGMYRAQNEIISTGVHFAEAGRRYPEAMIIHAHIGGGGDWEFACKALRDVPGVYVDTSGSVHDAQMIDFALKYLGEDRMLFATDGSFEAGVGKILAANLNENQRKKIFFDNFNNLLRKAGNEID